MAEHRATVSHTDRGAGSTAALLPETPASASRVATILVVDDHPNNRLLIRHLFDDPAAYRVLEAADGAEGLTLATQERPDCLLLDLAMPGLSGFDVLERLQADPRTRAIPVIVLTATAASLENMERSLVGGAVDYLTKPISPAQVVVRVRGAIERRRLLAEVEDLRAGFTSMLIHDLRGPMTAIRGYLDLLGSPREPLTERQQRFVARMDDGVERMLRLIGEILDVSKLEAHKLVLALGPVDLSAVAGSALEQFAPAAEQKGIRLALDRGNAEGTQLAIPFWEVVAFDEFGPIPLLLETLHQVADILRKVFRQRQRRHIRLPAHHDRDDDDVPQQRRCNLVADVIAPAVPRVLGQ